VDAIVEILYWVQLTLLVLAVVAALLVAIRSSGSREFVAWRAIAQGALAAAVFGVSFVLAGAGSSILWTLVLLVIGVVVGYLLGAREPVLGGTGADERRRSGVAPWVWAVSLMLVTLTLLFGSTFLYGLAVLVMAFALGLVVGQIAGEFASAGRGGERGTAPAA
jgi:hypothetical protein